MTERVRAVGGELQAGPTSAGGWQVVATIPSGRAHPVAGHHDPETAWATLPTAG